MNHKFTSVDSIPFNQILCNDDSLTHLYLDRLGLGKHEDELALLVHCLSKNRKIVVLDISHNKIKDNGIKYIYQIIQSNSSITNLNISYNHFSACSIKQMTPLVKTNFNITQIGINEYITAPTDIFNKINCPRINHAKKDIYSSIEQNKILQLCLNEASTALSFTSRSLSTIPEAIFTMNYIKKLDISNNNLTTISKELYELSCLEYLNLSNNMIYNLEASNIVKLTNLTELHLQNNLLSSIPFRLCKLPLKILHIEDNLIRTIHTLSYYSLMENSIKVSKNGSKKLISPELVIPYMHLYFLGTTSSHVGKLFGFLKRNQLDSYKTLSAQERSHLLMDENDFNIQNGIFKRNWIPTNSFLSFMKKFSTSPRGNGQNGVIKYSYKVRNFNGSNSLSTSRNQSNTYPYTFVSSTIIDIKQSEYIHSLLLSGSKANFPIIIGYKVSMNLRKMVTNIIRILYSVDSLNDISNTNHAPIFIVATYKEAKDKMRYQISNVSATIVRSFPWLKIRFLTACITARSDKMKNFRDKILEGLQNQAHDNLIPFLHKSISTKCIDKKKKKFSYLIEYLNCLKEDLLDIDNLQERYKKSYMKWDEFKDIILKYNFKEIHCETISIILRHLGLIHHFRDLDFGNNNIENSPSNYIFLNINCIYKAFVLLKKHTLKYALVLVTEKNSLLATITIGNIKKIWKDLPSELYDIFLTLFTHSGQIFEISKGNYIISSTFDDLPGFRSVSKPPSWLPGENSYYIVRCYSFYKMCDKDFCKIFSLLYYCKGLCISDGNIRMEGVYKYCIELGLYENDKKISHCRVTYDYLKSCTTLFVCEGNKNYDLFKTISSKLEQLFSSDSEFQRTDPPVYVLCACKNCANSKTPKWIPLSQIEEEVAKGSGFFYCNNTAVRLDLLAPDVTLTDVEYMIVDYSDIKIKEKVGEGGFASVHRGRLNGNSVAVKELHIANSIADSFTEFRNEITLMKGLIHPNLVGLIGLCKNPLCLITEFCAFGDLFSYIRSRKKRNLSFPESFILSVLLDIANGMYFLHNTVPPVIHRDLKSANILLCKLSSDENTLSTPIVQNIEKGKNTSPTAKVADFGLSLQTCGPITGRVVSNPIWLAPELLADKPYSFASDVYAFGIIAFELYSLEFPFDEYKCEFSHLLEKMIIDGKRPTVPQYVNHHMTRLIESCWSCNPSERPTFADILKKISWVKKLSQGQQLQRTERFYNIQNSL